ncbi:MAG: dicarboxylate/amino acid:cation symporter [Chlamydiota bacterium]
MTLTAKRSYSPHIMTLIAIISGVATGLSAPAGALLVTQELASIFMNLFKLLSAPMIFLAIVSTLTQMESLTAIRSIVKKILKYTFFTTLIAATVGLLLFLLINPTALIVDNTSPLPDTLHSSYWAVIKSMVPTNILQPFLENNVIAIALIAAALSLALQSLPKEKSRPATSFFQSLFDALLFLTSKLMATIPIAIFAFTTQFAAQLKEQATSLVPILWYAFCILAANLIQGIVVLPLILKAKGHSPLHVAKKMMPALTIAFLSKSSNIALPVSLECAIHRLKISDRTARFSFPLCSVINMNGCAAFILITTLFVCSSHGIVFTFWEMGLWIFIATLAAIGNAGVPMGCFFLTSAFLIGMGVPLDMMGVILPLYAIFDMVETALNVWSDSCVTSLVDREVGVAHQTCASDAGG